MQHPHLVVFCTCPDKGSADTLATTLVEENLAACVNILPAITSVYRWKGQVEKESETLLLIKTSTPVYSRLESRIQQLHPYELPEVIAVPITLGSEAYLGWLQSMTGVST